MTHTPGPWKLIHDDHGFTVLGPLDHVTTISDGEKYIASNEGFVFDDEDRYNASLICASPNLLEACKAALDLLNRMGEHSPIQFGGEAETAEKLRAAIAKAEGN